MSQRQWISDVRVLLGRLSETELGYEFGLNEVHPASDATIVSQVLRERGLEQDTGIYEFYHAADGVSWPDVHNGYFIRGIATLAGPLHEFDPVRIEGNTTAEIVAFGSTGGGALFAIRKFQNDILVLRAAEIQAGVYYDRFGSVEVVAHSFSAFLDKLKCDLAAFVNDEHDYQFMG